MLDWMERHCPDCAATLRADEARNLAAYREKAKPLASLAPLPGPLVEVSCRICGNPFTTESTVFRGDSRVPEKQIYPTICDECAELEKRAVGAMRLEATTPEERRRLAWVEMVGVRYAEFRPADLPAEIRPHVSTVMAWTPQPRGIGLLGPSGTGKSPLLYGLAQKLYNAGHDVFCTSGIKFQKAYIRGIESRPSWEHYLGRCEGADVLFIDDADKLNLTPGVESEYYGMLEHRRNWQKPLLCTLNLSGPQIEGLAKDRHDRASAIVSRLRDLSEFITINPPTKPQP